MKTLVHAIAAMVAVVLDALARNGFEGQVSTSAELAAHVKEQLDLWGRVIRDAGIPCE